MRAAQERRQAQRSRSGDAVTVQYSVALRNAALDIKETTIGPSAILKVFSGIKPANCAAADPTGLLCTIALSAGWMAAAVGGVKSKLGAWTGTASADGAAASWRIYAADGATCGMQGDMVDMTIDSTSLAVGQTVTVNTFTITAGNA